MSASKSTLLFTVCAVMLSAAALSQTPQIRIMPLGDSITYGSSTPGGYRFPLYTSLTNAGYNVHYVGSQNGNATNLLPEIWHEGHGGWKISDPSIGLYENMYGWFETIEDPHVVLLHIGTNDSGGGTLFTNAIDRLDALITRIAQCQPSAHIIVTSLMKRNGSNYDAITNYFNPYVPGKVAAQQALGRNVHFLDMHASLELTDMYDGLHPNPAGYAKMAAAWYTAVTNIIGTNVVANQPAMIRALAQPNNTQVVITFNKKISYATATNAANYAIDKGISVLNASLNASQRAVTLTIAPLSKGVRYTLTLNNLADETAPTPLTIPAGTQATLMGQTPRGYLNNVPESGNYSLVYALDLPSSSDYRNNLVPYAVDNSALVGPFTRVAYYLELQKAGEDLQYAWVSMDAFTNRADKLGLPTLISGELYQQYVNNLSVTCNVPGVVNGTGLSGNIEFWPYDYSAGNAKSIPAASASNYDFGDTCSFANNYSCMQVHNYAATQTIFAVNHWGANSTLELGIGNCTNPVNGGVDWTFSNNGGNYTVRSLYVLVLRNTADTTPPLPVSAQAGFARNLVTVTFSETLAASSVNGTCFSLNNGVTVLSATLLPDLKTVNLMTTHQPFNTPLTLSVSGVRDISPAANATPAGTTLAVAAPVLPPEIITNVGTNSGQPAAGYELVYTLDVPLVSKFNSTIDPYRYNQSSQTGAFDRVAYYLELQKADGTVQYVWTSMDAFTTERTRIGVPVVASGATFQRYVSNLDVKSNVAGVSNGTGMAYGNIEFWPGNYDAVNTISITNASASNCDWGDHITTTTAGHGCMQVHNALYGHTVFAINHWGTDNNTVGLGIGNNPNWSTQKDLDWTFQYNAATYARRTLHVLARPSVTPPPLPPEVQANVPGAAGYQLAFTFALPTNGSFASSYNNFITVNNTTNGLPATFTRVAYYLELQSGANPTQWVWTAMDAFTSDPRKIAIPTNNCFFQQKVTRLDVLSNVGGIVNGNTLSTGNIEIWPSNYGQSNALGIPNANNATFDFGDSGGSSTGGGYGCFQVHNHGSMATQTIFAVNHLNDVNSKLCIGIGNRPTADTDWTFADNAATYNHRRLHVFILPGGDPDVTRPTLTTAVASRTLTQVAVTFSEPLADIAATPSFFALNNGVTVSAARLSADLKTVTLTTSPMAAGANYTLTVSGVCDRSANANPILPASTLAFTTPSATLPSVLTNIAEIAAQNYQLVHQLAVGNTVNYQSGCNYTVDQSRFTQTQSFDRVAYCMELLTTNGVYKWVYVSMDAYTADIAKIGVPTADRNTLWQTYVSNLNVYASANVANLSVTTGIGIATGNIEFWPSNYGESNDKSIPGALGNVSGTKYFDFGDGGGPNTTAGHGSMQIHNYLQGHTIFAMNAFGSNGRTPCLGIGNNTNFTSAGNIDTDWTFFYNAPMYSTKNIYVLARPTTFIPNPGTGPEIWNQPLSQAVITGANVLFSVYAPAATGYQWRKNGQWIAGATLSYLSLAPAMLADRATYDVIVFNASASYTVSQSATLTVYPLGTLLKIN